MLCLSTFFCFFGCKESGNDGDKIELTTENVSFYLVFDVRSYPSVPYSYTSCYQAITSTVSISGASSNFSYYNVVVEMKIYGQRQVRGYGTRNYTQEIKCSLNVGGNGSNSVTDYYGGEGITSIDGTRYVITNVHGYVEKVK